MPLNNSAMHEITPYIHCNDAGLKFWLEHQKKPKDPLCHVRCLLYPWVCPFMHSGEFPWPPCRYKGHGGLRKLGKYLAFIGYEIGIPHREPIGQMSLWEPYKTHGIVWRHWLKGYPVEPYTVHQIGIVCKKMALAVQKFEERGIESVYGRTPANWKIIPLEDDPAWVEEQSQKQGVKPCWFDTV